LIDKINVGIAESERNCFWKIRIYRSVISKGTEQKLVTKKVG